MSINTSFTAASTIPAKLITDDSIIHDLKINQIRPVHVQLNPTNRCPLNCSFCSCKNRDKGAEIPLNTAEELINKLLKLGTRAITITGGGDPLAYKYINSLISYIADRDIKIGLVTNGRLFDSISMAELNKVTWCRVSLSPEQPVEYLSKFKDLFEIPIDWSFSYVLTDNTHVQGVINAINTANKHHFTHVRIVDDILRDSCTVEAVRTQIKAIGIDDSRVIYQGRKIWNKGNKRCLISLLKPNIDASGNIYPCCGIQYAASDPSLTFDNRFSMGSINNIEKLYIDQKFFDGSICSKCFYSDYNDVMGKLWDYNTLQHKEFI